MNRTLIDWWASPSEIGVPVGVCPASPEGQRQTAQAVIAAADWHGVFSIAAFTTLVFAILLVLLAYETRAMGDRFWRRWWQFLGITAVLSFAASLIWVRSASVHTEGCEFGDVLTQIPMSYALNRASVSLVQSILLFVLISWLLTLIARVTRRQVWYNNSRIPFRF